MTTDSVTISCLPPTCLLLPTEPPHYRPLRTVSPDTSSRSRKIAGHCREPGTDQTVITWYYRSTEMSPRHGNAFPGTPWVIIEGLSICPRQRRWENYSATQEKGDINLTWWHSGEVSRTHWERIDEVSWTFLNHITLHVLGNWYFHPEIFAQK